MQRMVISKYSIPPPPILFSNEDDDDGSLTLPRKLREDDCFDDHLTDFQQWHDYS